MTILTLVQKWTLFTLVDPFYVISNSIEIPFPFRTLLESKMSLLAMSTILMLVKRSIPYLPFNFLQKLI